MIEPQDPAEKTDATSSIRPPAINPPSRSFLSSTDNRSGDRSSGSTASDAPLQRQADELKREIAELQDTRDRLVRDQTQDVQAALTRMVDEGLIELEQRRKSLQTSIDQLERRRERIQAEMRRNFAGVSQDLAVRVQGFKEYLVGSLQDLVTTAEELELGQFQAPTPAAPPTPPTPMEPAPSAERSLGRRIPPLRPSPRSSEGPNDVRSATLDGAQPSIKQPFAGHTGHIQQLLDQYRTMPNYYGRPWQLRRTFEPVHAERASQWFLDLGGRGAIKTMGSRLQNVLIASAVISVLRDIHGDRIRALILGDSPERLGEWRRGLQDCLGISRTDFGSQRGVVLFEAPDAVAQRAERLVEQDQIPLILIDEGEDKVSLSLLQFPLWLAFASDPADTLPMY